MSRSKVTDVEVSAFSECFMLNLIYSNSVSVSVCISFTVSTYQYFPYYNFPPLYLPTVLRTLYNTRGYREICGQFCLNYGGIILNDGDWPNRHLGKKGKMRMEREKERERERERERKKEKERERERERERKRDKED